MKSGFYNPTSGFLLKNFEPREGAVAAEKPGAKKERQVQKDAPRYNPPNASNGSGAQTFRRDLSQDLEAKSLLDPLEKRTQKIAVVMRK